MARATHRFSLQRTTLIAQIALRFFSGKVSVHGRGATLQPTPSLRSKVLIVLVVLNLDLYLSVSGCELASGVFATEQTFCLGCVSRPFLDLGASLPLHSPYEHALQHRKSFAMLA